MFAAYSPKGSLVNPFHCSSNLCSSLVYSSFIASCYYVSMSIRKNPKKKKKKRSRTIKQQSRKKKYIIKLKCKNALQKFRTGAAVVTHPHSHTEKVDDHMHVTLYFSHVFVMTQLWLRTRFNDACFGDEMN